MRGQCMPGWSPRHGWCWPALQVCGLWQSDPTSSAPTLLWEPLQAVCDVTVPFSKRLSTGRTYRGHRGWLRPPA